MSDFQEEKTSFKWDGVDLQRPEEGETEESEAAYVERVFGKEADVDLIESSRGKSWPEMSEPERAAVLDRNRGMRSLDDKFTGEQVISAGGLVTSRMSLGELVRLTGDLSNTDLRGIEPVGKDESYNGKIFKNADLSGGKLADTSFRGCDLTNADLRGADLRNCDFGQAILHDVTVDKDTDLRGADFGGALLSRIHGVSDINELRLRGAKIRNIVIVDAK